WRGTALLQAMENRCWRGTAFLHPMDIDFGVAQRSYIVISQHSRQLNDQKFRISQHSNALNDQNS
ncbi:MAG: hypothetical protein AAF637_23905, partial [Pseudomonadota bacterium]